MLTTLLASVAVALYLTAAARTAMNHHRGDAAVRPAGILVLWIAAMVVHALLLYRTTVIAAGFNLGVFNAASLVALLMAATLLLVSLQRPLPSLAVVLLPVAAFSLTLDLVFPVVRMVPDPAGRGVVMHIALAMVAYSLFALACIQAVFIALAEYKLRHHHPIMHFLPPLQTMEGLLFRITGIAFALLSVSLVLGGLFTRDVLGQHLAHKIVFSVLAWLIFAVLLWGRWRFGWRGTRAVRYVIGGSILLALGYFGSKIVLELILHRV